MWELYDTLIDGVTSEETIEEAVVGTIWTYVKTSNKFGIAMTTQTTQVPSKLPLWMEKYMGISLKQAVSLVKSWDFVEASVGMAALNAWYNTSELMMKYHTREPDHQYCTFGMNLKNKKVGMVGHLRANGNPFIDAKEVLILERNPQDGDYPDSACEYLLPDCDVVIITGNAFTNKTMPRLLQICQNSEVVLTGPSVPMAPNLMNFNISRLAGLIITNTDRMKEFSISGKHGPPYSFGERFCLNSSR